MSQESSPAPAASKPPQGIYLVSYPKIVFLYPTMLAALLAGALVMFTGNVDYQHLICLGFLVILGVNLVVISFDFPRGTSLTLFFFLVAIGFGLWLVFSFNPDLVPLISRLIHSLKPEANPAFYFSLAGILALIYVAVLISVQFDYWEVRPNELLHHHGLLSDLERFSAPNLRIDKEITDVFEYMLLRSGRLILHPSNERRAIVLENVFFINRCEEQITRQLGALQVQVRTNPES